MRILRTVKTPLPLACLAAAAALAQELPMPSPTAPPAETVAAVQRALRPPGDPYVHPEIDSLLGAPVLIRVELGAHRLRVLSGDTVAIESPIAHGRAASPTAQGEFTLVGKQASPTGLNYGHLRNAAGAILARGVFQKIDPLPVGAIFDEVIPKCALRLSEGGPRVFAGEATGAATSDGAVILPDKVAVLIFQAVPAGTKVIIEP
jgi:hypothetical protein